MQEIKLQILAQDILETNYMDSEDCAITRALERSGLSKYRHVGGAIVTGTKNEGDYEILLSVWDSNLADLNNTVHNMYYSLVHKPKDFEFTLKTN